MTCLDSLELLDARAAVYFAVAPALRRELITPPDPSRDEHPEAFRKRALGAVVNAAMKTAPNASGAPRAMCPLCGSGGSSRLGFLWPTGLALHLLGDGHHAQPCIVYQELMAAIFYTRRREFRAAENAC